MAQPRSNAESPYILSLMKAIETQSEWTIATWSTAYAPHQVQALVSDHLD